MPFFGGLPTTSPCLTPAQVAKRRFSGRQASPSSLLAGLHEPPTGLSPPLSTALTSPPEAKAQLESNFNRRVRITPDPQKRKVTGTENPYRPQTDVCVPRDSHVDIKVVV